jgi:basic amino acid/polyamine antiporter, APA family
MANFFRRKSLVDILSVADSDHNPLKRQLTATSLVLLGIGAIIGAGLFSITGMAAANNAGPAVTISFIVAAVACLFAGLCYAEFASLIPVAGSAYTYAFVTMGELVAWVIGWDLVLEYAVGAATVSISWSRYLGKYLHDYTDWELPPAIASSMFETSTGVVNLPAMVIVSLISLLLIRGTEESARLNAFMVFLKVAIVLVFIVLGWGYMNPENHVPYIPVNTGEFGHFGWSGIVRAAGIIFFAYVGFDAVSTAAQEAKNPKRDMPIGILVSLLICTVLYILFAHVMTGLANYKEFQGADGIAPVAVAIGHTPFVILKKLIVLAILAGYCSVILVMLMGQSRVFYTMSADGLLPKAFSDVHKKFKTPYKSNLFFLVLVSLFAGFIPPNVVGEMTSIGTLFAFALVCLAVIIIRKKMPEQRAAFRTPFVPLVPILGIICCVGMMIALDPFTQLVFVGWTAFGLVIYFAYSNKNAERIRNEKTIDS